MDFLERLIVTGDLFAWRFARKPEGVAVLQPMFVVPWFNFVDSSGALKEKRMCNVAAKNKGVKWLSIRVASRGYC